MDPLPVLFPSLIMKGESMKIKRITTLLCTAALLACVLCIPVYAASGDVAGAIEGTWNTASQQIKAVVDNVVFPAIDLVLAVFFFAKLGTAYFDCAPVKAL